MAITAACSKEWEKVVSVCHGIAEPDIHRPPCDGGDWANSGFTPFRGRNRDRCATYAYGVAGVGQRCRSGSFAVKVPDPSLLPFARIAFVWFVVSLRMGILQRSIRRVEVALSNVQLVSGIVVLVLFSTSGSGKQTGVLPVWVAHLGFVVGLVMVLSASFNRGLIVVSPLWTLMVSVLIWMHSRQLADARISGGSLATSDDLQPPANLYPAEKNG